MRKTLMKSIFLAFFSLCFLCTGIVTLFMKEENVAQAETVIVNDLQSMVNNEPSELPDYVSIEEYAPGSTQADSTSLISDNTFLYYVNASSESNTLTISFKTNGAEVNTGSEDIYQYVYYPNVEDTSTFYFYTFESTNLYINGVQQTISADKEFSDTTSYAFANESGAYLETYQLNFSANDTSATNTISLLDADNNLIQGRYTVEITLVLWTCTDGRTDALEETFRSDTVNLRYEFLVLNRTDYISNTRPITTASEFDSSYQVTSTQSEVYGNYYYFNYSYEDNQIANITYDPTKYDVDITKTLNGEVTTESISYIAENVTEEEGVVTNDGITITGDEVVTYVKNSENSVTLYFKDVGNYSLTFNAVATFSYTQDGTTIYNKYTLGELTNQLKRIMIYGYGYQATYVDYDQDSVYTEFKSYENDVGEFDGRYYESADITSGFLASNESYGQNTSTTDTTGNTTFTINNVLNYISRNVTDDELASTNQSPIRFTSNATIASGNITSYVYSTTQVNNNYTQTSLSLNGQTLYRANYTGGSISEKGTYIFILAYTFNYFYTTSGQLSQNLYFYQVFYFEITGEPPVITLQDEDGTSVYSDTYTNQNVTIINANIDEIHNKDVTVQIYAYDYNNETYLSSYGGELGIDMLSAPGYDGGNTLTLEENAHYTIRLYYTNEMSTITTNINDNSTTTLQKVKRQYFFTIDKQKIDGITARNVSLISGTTNYDILQSLEGVSTNQDFIVSWNEKDSDAPTYAYYKYFPISESEYYTGTEEQISTLLYQFLQLRNYAFLPIDYSLDLNTEDSTWIRYMSNTLDLTTTTGSQNILSPVGLYLFDFYDAAGNHTYQIFIKDTTTPIFALQTDSTFSLIPTSYFISETSTLYWGDYKAIQIDTGDYELRFDEVSDINNIDSSLYEDFDLFYGQDGNPNEDIFRVFYESLYNTNLFQYIASPDNALGIYLTIAIDDVTYQTPIGSDDYERVEGQNYVELSTDTDQGYTYRVLIRDESNNRYVTGTDLNDDSEKDSFNQYASHYSARQTIIVSFDDSEFHLYYDVNGSEEILSSNNTVGGSVTIGEDDNQTTYSTLTTYLNPINLEEQIYLSFIPTKTDETTSQTVQVDTVTIEYYAYEQKTYSHTNEAGEVTDTSYYYSIANNITSRTTVYDYSTDGSSQTEFIYELMPNTDLITSAGKYVITRTYRTDDGFTINEKDNYSVTFVLYVDRNEVISSPITIRDENNTSHSESLVGGEIFVGMYDSGTMSDIVVTFPNSIVGSSQVGDTTLYNGNTSNSVWTTNKLPVRVYIPTYKYTMYAIQRVDAGGNYYYEVVNSEPDNIYYSVENPENDNHIIDEYRIYAEIYKDYQGAQDTAEYRTTTTWTENNYTNNGNFLTFYDASTGEPLEYLTEEGNYTIMVYQGYNSVAEVTGDTFRQVATFTFTIESVDPDFTARTQTGTTLNTDSVYYNGQLIERYHTNQDTIQILWDNPDDTDIFKAEIDQNNITVSVTANGQTTRIENVSADTLFRSIEESGSNYIGTLTFSALDNSIYSGNFYQNGNYIDITMRYQNHNDAYYETVTKRIIIDTQAPYMNIENLVSNVIGSTYNSNLISYEDLRTKSNILRENVTSNTETTYNTSTTSGTFRYFSYSVDGTTFLNILKSTATTESSTIYYRLFNNKYTTATTLETTPDSFLEGEFSNINSLTEFENGSYYEIVESDLAGNLTIYTIYVVDYSANDTAIVSYQTENNDELTSGEITQNDYFEALGLTNHTALLNIYSKPGLEITGINYFGNVWTNFTVTETDENGISSVSYYFTSPWLSDRIYRIDGTTFTEVSINSILDGDLNSRYKSIISFYDQVIGGTTNIYVNTRNTSLSASLTSDQTREYISFTQPTDSDLESRTIAYPFLTKIKIYTPASEADGTEEVVYYSDEFENQFGYADLWQNSQDVTVSYSSSRLTFELNSNLNLADNTRIVYEYTDNYGTTYTEIHLYHETTGYQEISSTNTLYSFYAEDNNLYYITADDFRYTFNEAKYSVVQYQYEDGAWVNMANTTSYVNVESTLSNSTIRTLRFYSREETPNYSYKFMLEIYDTARENDTDPPVKTVYFILNNEIPLPETQSMENLDNEFYFASNGRIITEDILGLNGEDQVDYYSRVSLNYRTNTSFLPIKFEISTDGVIWEEIASGTEISCPEDVEQQEYYLRVWYDMDEIENLGYIDQTGNYDYIFEVIPSSYVYTFRLSTTLTTAYYVTLHRDDATEIIQKSGQTYTTPGDTNTTVYANHYIVNINYTERESLLEIVTNAEQLIEVTSSDEYYIDADNVRTYIYTISNLDNIGNANNIPRFYTQIAITFIEPTNQFTSEFYTYNHAGIIDNNTNLISSSSLDFIVADTSSITQLELQWSKYYAIRQNVINIVITKNGYELTPTIYSKTENGREYYYTYITRSGRYRISFVDTAGNVQVFNLGNATQTESFTLTFLKDIPFTVTYTNPLTDTEETTEPISEAIYNGSITLRLDTNTSSYYTAAGVSLSVTRNGSEYTGYTYSNGAYNFTETGYYGVTFSAVSSQDNETNIRSQTYYFTILNPNEYRYSFIINKYSNYYIESIKKDGVDVTDIYLRSLNLDTIVANQTTYLAELTLSYLDEKTGAGTYIITVNSNERLYNSESTHTSWTFQVTIQVGRENLIDTSINAGEATTDPITVQFNAGNIYEEFGESVLQIIYYQDNAQHTEYSYNINADSTELQTYTIERTNEYFIQLVSPSGNLLYSAKVTKNEPFNAATIIAIVVSVVVLLIVIILIIVLRKRISVK